MVSYPEFKECVYRLLEYRNSESVEFEPNEDDIVIDYQDLHIEQDEAPPLRLHVSNDELTALYDKASGLPNSGLECYGDTHYEVALAINGPLIRRGEFPVVSEDRVSGIKYELGDPSLEYCACLILQLIQYGNDNNVPFSRFTRSRIMIGFRIRRILEEGQTISLTTVLPQMIGKRSLKIASERAKSLNHFRNYKNSFCVNFMFRSNVALVEFSDISDFFRLSADSRSRSDLPETDTPPWRTYEPAIIDYYRAAQASNDSYVKYLSFYHVMEYFFDKVFKNKIVAEIKDRITRPDFSYKNDKNVYDIALLVKQQFNTNREEGQGNEQKTLEYVLNEYIKIDDLKTRIDAIDPQAVSYYENNKVAFCGAPAIPWNDARGVYGQIAKRIYLTRNSLVHSKSGKSQERYNPYQNKSLLLKEIPLAKAVAESVMVNSSEIMK